jgi:twitching motility protein PilT
MSAKTVTEAPSQAIPRPLTMEYILREAVAQKASDIIISAGSPLTLHVFGKLVYLHPEHRLTDVESKSLAYSMLDEQQRAAFEKILDLDLSYELPNVGRFRVNVFQQRGSVSTVLRHVPLDIPHYSTIGITDQLMTKLAGIPSGLILVTGATGSGKSTTMASFIEHINTTEEHAKHVVTIEDPIEFRFRSKKCIIDQREVGIDVTEYHLGLRQTLRQMAHVIFVGEMRDRKTIEIALTAAETGNIVCSTLHTQSAAKTINRIIDVFPINDQDEVRTRLALTLRCVISQILLPRSDTDGRIAGREIMFVNTPIANLIREGKIHMINNVIASSTNEGMVLMDDHLIELYKQKKISASNVVPRIADPEKVRKIIGG